MLSYLHTIGALASASLMARHRNASWLDVACHSGCAGSYALPTGAKSVPRREASKKAAPPEQLGDQRRHAVAIVSILS